jgi:rRNA-processing protein FCF1
VGKKPLPPTYVERLQVRLTALEEEVVAVLESSTIRNIDPGPGFIGFPAWGWGQSDAALEGMRMLALKSLSEVEPLVRLLFPHPVARVGKEIDRVFKLLRGWLRRTKSSHSTPSSIPRAVELARAAISGLRDLLQSFPADADRVRLVVDTNALVDCPDLAVYTDDLGPRYRAHVMPVVLGELDDLKRSGRTPELRDAAAKAVRRLKGLRTNADPLVGMRVAGDVWAVFEHVEPTAENLPGWMDLGVPDDRFAASALLLQSQHPGSAVFAATGDINLQNKLSAVGIPFVEPPDR